MGFWSGLGNFAVTTAGGLVGGALGSFLGPAGTVAGAALVSGLAEAAWTGWVEGGTLEESLTAGAETGLFGALLGGAGGGAARGLFATAPRLFGRTMTNRAGRALAGALHPGVAATRTLTGRAARGWLSGAGAGAGVASLFTGAGPKSDNLPALLPTRPSGEKYRGAHSDALVP
ncbi:hypothetical protein AB0346_14435 [Nocardia beijingensis]|uniref:hypothetical protein n=1 Tax=Nocardia beijingensis TaxID=95162 RepID=UPI00344DF839